MDMAQVIDGVGEAVRMALLLAGPLLAAALAVALGVGGVQTLTQMHDPGVGLVPRLAAVLLALLAVLPWAGGAWGALRARVVGLVPRLAAVLLALLAVLPWAVESWVAFATDVIGSIPDRL